jgi:hypothetical protein
LSVLMENRRWGWLDNGLDPVGVRWCWKSGHQAGSPTVSRGPGAGPLPSGPGAARRSAAGAG